jgi:hypothetical protein
VHHINLATIHLAEGDHPDRSGDLCVMEAVAYFADEPHSDHPRCVSPAIGERQTLAKYIPLVVGTRTTDADEMTQAWLATDWLVRTFAPAWLRLAGLADHAAALEGLDALTSDDLARKAQPIISAADSAARSAADSAAYSAADSAAYSAARSAAYSAARSAARSAADSAAYSAARDALRPTVVALQGSAHDLLDRMISVGRPAELAA